MTGFIQECLFVQEVVVRGKKKGTVPAEKHRDRKSFQVGGLWRVKAEWNAHIHKFVVVSCHLIHTNGCDPSPSQRALTTQKKTKGKTHRIPKHVLDEIGRMFAEGQPIKWIRSRIRYQIPPDIVTDARWFMNLRVYFERRWLAEASGKTVLRTEGLHVLNILKSLKEKVLGFVYDYVIDKEGQLAGWCYKTPCQRAALEDSGHVIFCDFQAKATNKYGWPYFSPSVCNADNKNEVVMYGCCVSQACAWVMQCLEKFVPPIVKICGTLFTNDGLSEHVVGFYFPSTTHLICCFHVIDLDIFIVAKKVKYVHTEELRRNLWSKVIYCRTREAGDLYMRGLLERPMPIALKQRLQYWYSKFHKWGYIRHTFTAGFKGNTMGEVPFVAVWHWLTQVDDFRLL